MCDVAASTPASVSPEKSLCIAPDGKLASSKCCPVILLFGAKWSSTALWTRQRNARHTDLHAAGAISGNIALDNLTRGTDGIWVTKIIPKREEIINVTLSIDGVVAGRQGITIVGTAPRFINTTASLAAAYVGSSSTQTTQGLVGMQDMFVKTDEDIFIFTPAIDNLGSV